MCKLIRIAFIASLLALCLCAVAETWTCPNCGTTGLTDNFCTNCRQASPTPTVNTVTPTPTPVAENTETPAPSVTLTGNVNTYTSFEQYRETLPKFSSLEFGENELKVAFDHVLPYTQTVELSYYDAGGSYHHKDEAEVTLGEGSNVVTFKLSSGIDQNAKLVIEYEYCPPSWGHDVRFVFSDTECYVESAIVRYTWDSAQDISAEEWIGICTSVDPGIYTSGEDFPFWYIRWTDSRVSWAITRHLKNPMNQDEDVEMWILGDGRLQSADISCEGKAVRSILWDSDDEWSYYQDYANSIIPTWQNGERLIPLYE